MKNAKFTEKAIRIAALLTLLLIAAKCAAQTLRIETAAGQVVFSESGHPDEICFSFGVMAGELKTEHLDKTAKTLPGKVAAAARMADDAGVKYPDFLRENGVSDSPAIYEYYRKCRALRRQFFAVMGERAFLEVRHQVELFN